MCAKAIFRKEWYTIVDNIRAYGSYKDSGEGRRKVLGAKSIAVFCTGCEPNYSNYQVRMLPEVVLEALQD